MQKKLQQHFIRDTKKVRKILNIRWKDLTDNDCQIIRELFSIYRDTTGMLDLYDFLSNRYLKTKGNSRGSFDVAKGMYTGGIFTGAKTSSNHEIWERVIEITKRYYHDQYNDDFRFITWSFPGGLVTPFIYEVAGKKYYDKQCKNPFNHLAQFKPTIDEYAKRYHQRSWVQVLRSAGYKITHDANYPSRYDGTSPVMMSKQFIFNARLSRCDALTYPTNRTVSYINVANDYPESFFKNSAQSQFVQMYEDKGEFYKCIEAIRHDTANGMIHGEVIDSEDTYSEKIFLSNMLEYCKEAGIKIVSKAEAYDICFNHEVKTGNLIYNQNFDNTVKCFLKQADDCPTNPDGYVGDCKVICNVGEQPVLVTNGPTIYLHYGIPCGKISYSIEGKGNGNVNIYAIKNSDTVELDVNVLTKLSEIRINSDEWDRYECSFEIKNNHEAEYEKMSEGLGDKFMGLKMVYSEGICVRDIILRCV